MAAGANRQYRADFLIGAKILGSFKGAMASAQARMKSVNATAMRMGKSLLGFAAKLGTLITGIGAFALGHALSSFFHDAIEEAQEAAQRTRALSAALMENQTIAKGGPAKMKEQLDLIQQHNKLLEDQGVLHKDILDDMAVQLSLKGGIPPEQLMKSIDMLQNILVVSKGVTATQEEGKGLATAWALAVQKGVVKSFGQTTAVSKEMQKAIKGLKSPQERYNALIKVFGKLYTGENKKARKSDEGRIQLLKNHIKTMKEEVGQKLLPLRAKLADIFSSMLTPSVTKGIGDALEWIIGKITELTVYARDVLIPAFNRWKPTAINKIKDAFQWLSDNIEWLKPLVVSLTAAWVACNAAMAIAAVANPLGLAVAGIIAASAALYELNAHWAELEQRRDGIGETVRAIDGLQGAYDKWLGVLDKGHEKLVDLWHTLQPVRDWVWKLTKAIAGGLYNALVKMANALNWVMSPLNRLLGMKPPSPVDISQGWQDMRNSIPSPAQINASKMPKYGGPFASGGIVTRPTLGLIGEKGPEAVVPLGRGGGMGTTVNFNPQITINGNAGPSEQAAMNANLRSLVKDFIAQFKAAQTQERRLSYESGYA